MKNTFLCLLLLFITTISFAQKQANIWYFGDYAGIDFNSGSPVALTNSSMRALEGCATIADQNGDLMFYTNGDTVWNKNHMIMQNGTGLMGFWSSTQSSLIVPFPSTPDNYYIFTTDAVDNAGIKGLRYSIVDMTLNAGFGAVTIKNDSLYAPITEKLTSVKHSNGNDIWVISHEHDTTLFVAYLITNAGVSASPVISNVGNMYLYSPGSIGQLKVSPDGSTIATAVFSNIPTAEVYRFDNSTGIVSNRITLALANTMCYGIEFSPDSKKVYCASDNVTKTIHQYNLSVWDSVSVNSSQILIGNAGSTRLCGMQLAPDGKIYVAHTNWGWPVGGPYLGVINFPDSAGVLCNYVDNGFFLNGKSCNFGLPNFVQSYFIKPNVLIIGDSIICQGESTSLHATGGTNYQWAEITNPATIISTADSLLVNPAVSTTYLVYSNNDTAIFNVYVTPLPVVYLGNDTSICAGQNILLNAATPSATYLWNNNTTNPFLNVNASGIYWVDVTINNCTARDSTSITVVPAPVVFLGNDTSLCQGAALQLNATTPNATYVWQDNSVNPTFIVTQQGIYWVQVTVNNCSTTDTIIVNYTPLPVISLGNDTTLCQGSVLLLNANTPDATYLWQDNSTNPVFNVTQQGNYWIQVTVNHCSAADTTFVNFLPIPVLDLGNDTTLCAGTSLTLDASTPNATYLWQDNSVNAKFFADRQGIYRAKVTVNNCSVTDSVQIAIEACDLIVPNAFSPNGDGLNDEFRVISNPKFEILNLSIYNRRGQCVFTIDSDAYGWNGNFKGQSCGMDTYFYLIKYKQRNYSSFNYKKGNVTLIR